MDTAQLSDSQFFSQEALQHFIQAQSDKAADLSNMSAQEFITRLQKYAEQERQQAFNKKIKLSSVEYDGEKDLFLDTFTSEDTRDAYCRSINFAENYAATLDKSLLEFTPAEADDFIYSLTERSPASVRRDVAAVSSFFTFLERRHKGIQNPFRGTRARPKKRPVRPEAYPCTEEVNYIISHLKDKKLAAIIYIMAYRGLRVGAFQGLSIRGGQFKTISKGKEYRGTFSAEIISMIKELKLPMSNPFSDISTVSLKSKIKYEIEKMYRAGAIKAPYSAHDFRHYYAAQEYAADHDIYRVSKLLNHANIAITETYLKSIHVLM
ncbi:MAG TPA: site-specific integrase [Candidatus Treponema faecavium]|nr:site-specific integrase [Candidatus Treponema faecavium]